MEILKSSGLPIYVQDNEVLALSAELTIDGYSRKTVGQMKGLLLDETDLNEDDICYDVYRGIRFPEDEDILDKNKYRYDITYIMPGLINKERKKTSGHFHGYTPEKNTTYGEVYEVLSGTAYYVMQKSPNFDGAPEDLVIDDVIIVKVEAGQAIIIPPEYGHVSINGGEGSFAFSNLAYVPCDVLYDAVKYHKGMSYYIIENEEGDLDFVANENYKNLPQARFATVKEAPHFGIEFGKPVYQSYIENPDKFDFLKNPYPYIDEVMSLLVFEE